MSVTYSQFVVKLAQFVENLNDGKSAVCHYIVIHAVAYFKKDGSFKCVDIESIMYKDAEVTDYVRDCMPTTWESLRKESASYYLNKPCPQQKSSL